MVIQLPIVMVNTVQLHPGKWVVFINGNEHAVVDAYDRGEALDIVMERGVGFYIHDMDAEPCTGSDEAEEDYYPSRLYGN